MRRLMLTFLVCLLGACAARAQVGPQNSAPVGFSATLTDSPFAASPPAVERSFASLASFNAADAAFGVPAGYAPPSPPEPPQGVYGVFPEYNWVASVGYTFLRFNEVPSVSENSNGVYGSIVYYVKDWIGAEGQVSAVFGTLSGSTTHLVVGAGGVRLRRRISRNFDLWGHALAGFANLTPQTPYGKTTTFGWLAGGGVDIGTRHHLGYRIEADAVGTLFFNTYQVSPSVSAGIIYRF